MESDFIIDLKAEKEIGKFLDKYFYNQNIVRDFQRCERQEDQDKGIDVKFSIDDLENIIVDEKCQCRYVNDTRDSFIMEIKSSKYGGKGWFIDPKKETQFYLLVWPHKVAKNKGFKAEDINKLECVLLEKKR